VQKRKVITRSGARVRGLFASLKSERLIPWESQLERDALLVLEFDHDVLRMREFQECLDISVGDAAFRAYPDIFVEAVDSQPLIIEVKSDADAADENVRRRLALIGSHLSESCQRYVVWCEREIRQQPRLGLLELLATYRRPGARAHLRSQSDVLRLLQCGPQFSCGFAERHLGTRNRVLQLVANDLLTTDLTVPFASSSILRAAEEYARADVSH
jgi:hypothetical protein